MNPYFCLIPWSRARRWNGTFLSCQVNEKNFCIFYDLAFVTQKRWSRKNGEFLCNWLSSVPFVMPCDESLFYPVLLSNEYPQTYFKLMLTKRTMKFSRDCAKTSWRPFMAIVCFWFDPRRERRGFFPFSLLFCSWRGAHPLWGVRPAEQPGEKCVRAPCSPHDHVAFLSCLPPASRSFDLCRHLLACYFDALILLPAS